MVKLIAVLVMAALVALLLILDAKSNRDRMKLVKSALSEGNTIVYYECRNKEFGDYREIGKFTVIEGGDEWFKYTDGKKVYYDKYSLFGVYDDKVEVYEGDRLIYTSGFEL